jgi:hypothetical protein
MNLIAKVHFSIIHQFPRFILDYYLNLNKFLKIFINLFKNLLNSMYSMTKLEEDFAIGNLLKFMGILFVNHFKYLTLRHLYYKINLF